MQVWVAITLVALVGLLLAEYRDASGARAVCKPVASAGFVGLATSAGALDTHYGAAILVGLCLSWVGDLLLLSARKGPFTVGIGFFLAAHVAFCAAFWVAGIDVSASLEAALVLLIPAFFVGRWLLPQVDTELRYPVVAYIVVISVMVALSIGTAAVGNWRWIVAGTLAFYCSDISVAIDRFVRPGFFNRLWGLPLYYAAQLTLAWSVAKL